MTNICKVYGMNWKIFQNFFSGGQKPKKSIFWDLKSGKQFFKNLINSFHAKQYKTTSLKISSHKLVSILRNSWQGACEPSETHFEKIKEKDKNWYYFKLESSFKNLSSLKTHRTIKVPQTKVKYFTKLDKISRN